MIPVGEKIVSYGGGVNSVAVLIRLRQLGVVPKTIVMANPGNEWRATMRYLAEVTIPFCERVGFPSPVVISRTEEGAFREKCWRRETLMEECLRLESLPSVAYGWKKCSQKHKAETQRWWVARQQWALDEWASGRRIVKVIGYDGGEDRRVRKAFQDKWENDRFVPWYPLVDAKIDREGCEALIKAEGLPQAHKSACTYCPNNTLAEWVQLRQEEPDSFAAAVHMSRTAEPNISSPEVVGLMRCNPHGKRQLHVWADGGYGVLDGEREVENDQPCECAL